MNAIQAEIERLDQLSVADLVARYVEVHGRPPRSKNRRFLEKRIAFKVAEAATGGLSEIARRRLSELMAEIELPLDAPTSVSTMVKRPTKHSDLAVGTAITKTWHGQTIVVTVVENGFEWNGTTFNSLTAVAKAITGSHWNGRLFFGLAGRKGK